MSSTQKSTFGSAKRLLATAASAAMIFALLPAGAALGESPDNICPAPGGDETFPDVNTGVHADNIECLAGYDIVDGYPDGEYKPELDVFRAQMATFIVGLIEAARGEAMPAGENAFDDDDTSVHHANINKLAEAGIVQGQGGDYNPARKVNRAAMATFIANAVDYVDDQDAHNNSVLPAAAADHFVDDEASTHEENINRLADAGIVEGVSAGQYDPEVIVFRGQMASFVIGAASYLEEQGLWAANDVAPTTNQTYTVTPGDAAENTVGDDRQYSVSGLDDDTTYDVRLFLADDVTEDANGVVTFEDDPNNNEADTNAVDAVITVVNGTVVGGTQDEHVEASAVNGTLSFTIESDTAESVIPVVWVDTENDGTLELDADDQPTEAFGIGGQKTWIPAEAGQGTLGTDEDIISVDKAQDRIITETATYFYDSNDTFYIAQPDAGIVDDDCDGQVDQVTMAEFEAELSAGDELDADTFYQPNEELPSEFCLEDLAPAAPTALDSTDTTDTTTVLTVSGVSASADEVTAYCEVVGLTDPTVTTSSDVCASATEDADTATDGFQIDVTGLEPDTDYDFAASQTVGDEESDLSPEERVSTAEEGATVAPTIEDAQLTLDSPLVGTVDSGDVWTMDFTDSMSVASVDGSYFDLTDPDGDLIRVVCHTATPTPTTDFETDALCELTDTNTLRVELREDAEDRNAAGDAGTTGGSIEYPLTIQNVEQLSDSDGNEVDVTNSADRVIDDE